MQLRILKSACEDLDRGRAFYARHPDVLGDSYPTGYLALYRYRPLKKRVELLAIKHQRELETSSTRTASVYCKCGGIGAVSRSAL